MPSIAKERQKHSEYVKGLKNDAIRAHFTQELGSKHKGARITCS